MFKEKMFTPKEVQELKNMCIGEVKKVHGIVFVATEPGLCRECAFYSKNSGIFGCKLDDFCDREDFPCMVFGEDCVTYVRMDDALGDC